MPPHTHPQARAYFDTKPEDLARTVVLGRHSNNPRGPVSIGEPRIVLRTAGDLRSTAFGMSPWDFHSKIKDLFWYVEKWSEGKANILTNQALLKHAATLSRIEENFQGGNFLAKGTTLGDGVACTHKLQCKVKPCTVPAPQKTPIAS